MSRPKSDADIAGDYLFGAGRIDEPVKMTSNGVSGMENECKKTLMRLVVRHPMNINQLERDLKEAKHMCYKHNDVYYCDIISDINLKLRQNVKEEIEDEQMFMRDC